MGLLGAANYLLFGASIYWGRRRPRNTRLSMLLARRVKGIHLAPFEQGEIGPELFLHACLRDRPYRPGRSPNWIKYKNRQHPAFSRVMDQLG